MNSLQDLYSNLKLILKLLKDEKKALIDNDGNKVMTLVEAKTLALEKLSKFKGYDIENSKKIISIINEINELQEINLLLTRQALSFQEVLLESISRNIQNLSNTYSGKGHYQVSTNINLVDESV